MLHADIQVCTLNAELRSIVRVCVMHGALTAKHSP